MEITQLPITAYLVPDPLDEYNSTEPEWLEWIPGFNKDTEEDPVFDEGRGTVQDRPGRAASGGVEPRD